MQLLDDFVTTKYNIILAELQQKKKRTAAAGTIAGAGSTPSGQLDFSISTGQRTITSPERLSTGQRTIDPYG